MYINACLNRASLVYQFLKRTHISLVETHAVVVSVTIKCFGKTIKQAKHSEQKFDYIWNERCTVRRKPGVNVINKFYSTITTHNC